jgi:hypothetical protein
MLDVVRRQAPPLTDQLGLLVLASAATFLLVGDFNVRMASIPGDDGPIAYTWYFLNPSSFRLDIFMQEWAQSAGVSMLNWLPALVVKHFGVGPEPIAEIFVYLQNVVLALAVFRLGFAVTSSRVVAWLSAIFVLGARPHWWNLAVYGDLDWMPYTGWMSLAFLTAATAYALESRWVASVVLVSIGSLIHPVLGLAAVFSLGAYYCWLAFQTARFRKVFLGAGLFASVAAVSLAPALMVVSRITEAPSPDVFHQIASGGHGEPWADLGHWMGHIFIGNLIAVFSVILLGIVFFKEEPDSANVKPFFAIVTLIALSGCILHLTAYYLESPRLFRLLATRWTIYLMVIATPLAVGIAAKHLCYGTWRDRILAGYFLILPSYMSVAAAALVWQRGLFGRTGKLLSAVGLVLFGVVLARHLPWIGSQIDDLFVRIGLSQDLLTRLFRFETDTRGLLAPSVIVLLLVGIPACAYLSKLRPKMSVAAFALLAALPMAGLLLLADFRQGMVATSQEGRDYYDAQVWARSKTPSDSAFIVQGRLWSYQSWRTLTRRPVVAASPVTTFYVVSANSAAYNERLRLFYKERGKARYSQLDGSDLRAFADRFGADFVVRRIESPLRELRTVFQNSTYVIYQLR